MVDKVCLNTSQMLLSYSGIEQSINAYLIPFIIVFGATGNIINLTVLLTSSLRSRSNKLLAALAIADIFFLLMLTPHSLANYESIGLNSTFRQFYFLTKFTTLALANWSSAVAIWLILTICFERLIGIRYPLSSRKSQRCNTNFLIIGIVLVAGVLTAYHHFTYDCAVKIFCYGTQVHSMCVSADSDNWFPNKPNPHSMLLRLYIRFSPYLNAVIVILLPTVFIVFSNVLLVKTLNERKAFLRISTSVKCDVDSRAPSTNQLNAQLRTEQRVTLTVCLIVTSFIITQTPSAIYQVFVNTVKPNPSALINTIRIITTLLVTLGKCINFILFCLSSPSFRQRLISLTKNRFSRSIIKKSGHLRKISVETEMTISCSCNENHSLLRNPSDPCRCASRAMSFNDTRQKSFIKGRTNTIDCKEHQSGTNF